MPLADPTPPAAPVRAPEVRFPFRPLLLLVLLLAAAAAGVMLLLRPQLVFTNRLAGPVRLVVGDGAPRTVAPGASARQRVPRGQTLVMQWELIRPLSADGQPMGEVVRGSSVLRQPSGTVRATAASRTADADFFAPLVTNATAHPLRVTVNAGLQGALDCGCAVRTGTRRVFIGYYRLYRNSTVRASASGAGAATFRDLGPQVTSPDGTVGLRFEDRDLRR
jgi:hypothetical protein